VASKAIPLKFWRLPESVDVRAPSPRSTQDSECRKDQGALPETQFFDSVKSRAGGRGHRYNGARQSQPASQHPWRRQRAHRPHDSLIESAIRSSNADSTSGVAPPAFCRTLSSSSVVMTAPGWTACWDRSRSSCL